MHQMIVFAVGLMLMASVQSSRAYLVDTHREMSEAAFSQSLTYPYLGRALPFDAEADIRGIRPLYPGLEGVEKQAPRGWLGDGAVDEDDWTTEGLLRFRNHFYNPLNGSGLSYFGVAAGLPSPGAERGTW